MAASPRPGTSFRRFSGAFSASAKVPNWARIALARGLVSRDGTARNKAALLPTERRPVQSFGGEGEHLASRLGDADRVLELRRQRPVAGHRRPAVRQDLHRRLAEIDHRLDGEEHAWLELQALARLAVVQDVRPVMEHAAQAMAAELARHAAPL